MKVRFVAQAAGILALLAIVLGGGAGVRPF